MRASRLVSLVLNLQARGPWTAEELAEQLGVSVRTIHRDVEALREAGVPITGERGPAGGYRLPGGYRTRLTGLSGVEAQALLSAAPVDELGLGGFLADAHLKVLAALPPELRDRADRATQLLHVDRDEWFRESEAAPALPVLTGALWAGQRVRLTHRGRSREVDPWGLVRKGQAWYLMAGTARGPRTFRVSRVDEAVTLDEQATRPADFDLPAAWAEFSAAFEATVPLVAVRVRVQPSALAELRARADLRRRDALPASLDAPTELDVHFETLEIAEWELRAMGADAVAIEPPELVRRLGAFAERAARAYRAA